MSIWQATKYSEICYPMFFFWESFFMHCFCRISINQEYYIAQTKLVLPKLGCWDCILVLYIQWSTLLIGSFALLHHSAAMSMQLRSVFECLVCNKNRRMHLIHAIRPDNFYYPIDLSTRFKSTSFDLFLNKYTKFFLEKSSICNKILFCYGSV